MKLGILQNNEGISPVLGFILMLAIGVTILTTVQMTFVPVWNTDEELSHLKIMQDDFKVLKSNIETGILGGTTLSSPLIMGFKYSPKVLVYNPREEAYASLEVRKDAWVELRYNEVFPEGMTDDTSIKNVSTGMMVYALQGARNYNSYIYENGLIRRNGTNYTTSSQTVLANNTIFLPSVKALEYGTLSGVEKKSINIYPTSQQKNSVIGKNVWIILHTDPNYVEWWANTLENEGVDVKKKDPLNGLVIANVSTSLIIKMGEAYISSSQKAAPPHSPARRIVRVSGTGSALPVGGTTTITVEVQDDYNNPVPNVPVIFSKNMTLSGHPSNSNSNATILPDFAVSGSDGRASVTLTVKDSGLYYIDASLTDYKTTIIYSASSQGSVLNLDHTGSDPEFNIIAVLTDSFGGAVSGKQVTFDTSDGIFTTTNPNSTVGDGTAGIMLNISDAYGIKITNIQVNDTIANTANITWDTINNIIVTAKSGYIFNSRNVPTDVIATGCVMYGTSPGVYPYTSACDTGSSHSILLSGLAPNTEYYFIVNSNRPGKESVNSTEYMFVTKFLADDGVPPASISGLSSIPGALSINWTWIDPSDADFDHVQIYIDGNPKGTVNRGMQYFNSYYFLPGTSHTISTRTVDLDGRINATWVNNTATAGSAYTYVNSFESPRGSVSNPDDAKNATDGLSAIMAEDMAGGTNKTNRTSSPGKTIDIGAQSGIYDPSYLSASDSNIDITLPEKQIKTVVYYMGQRENTADLAANNYFTTAAMNVYLPEQGVVVKKAWLELQQLSGTTTTANVNTINMLLNGVDYSVINTGTYQANSGESLITVARADVTSAFSAFTNPKAYTAAVRTSSAASNAQALLLYITYEYDPNSPMQLKTIRYPLDTKTGQIAAPTSTGFVYNVFIPESATVRSSWFEIRGKLDANTQTDALIQARIAPNATFSTGVSLDMRRQDNFEFLYLFKTTPEFTLNSQQTLTVRNQNQIVYTLGGEVVVTYEYPISSPVHLKTVKYFVGQQTATGGTATLSDSTTVFIPEQSVKIKSVYARTRATYSTTTAGTHTIAGRIGITPTASQAYTVDTNQELIGNYIIIYNMTSAASSLVDNTMVFLDNTFSNGNHGPPGTELYITYEYDPSSPSELKTVEYLAGQSTEQVTPRNEAFDIYVPESTAIRRSVYIDYDVMSSRNNVFSTTSAIDTVFSSQTVNMDSTGEIMKTSVLNNDPDNRIQIANNVYGNNYSSDFAASFSGVARLSYGFRKNYSLKVNYTFTETNLSSTWKSITIKDSSYADALADVSIFNNASGLWESLFPTGFSGGATPAQHVNTVVGASDNAGDYDAGSGQIKIMYNWTGATAYNNLGVDLLNVTVNYAVGGDYLLNITSNTTEIPDSTNHQLQIKYYVSGDNFTLQVWDGTSWNNRATLNKTSPDYYNYTLLPGELKPDVSTTDGTADNINQYYVLVRYVDVTSNSVQGKLYLDYQRVYSS